MEPFRSSKASGQVSIGSTTAPFQFSSADSNLMVGMLLHRNTSKIKDWIDAVYVKKRFYSAEAAAAATHLPPVSHSQAS